MAQNYITSGDTQEIVLGSGETALASGKGRLVGARLGVILSLTRDGETVFANQASAQGDIAAVKFTGVFELPKVTSQAWATIGAKVYWDDTNKRLTTSSSGNTQCGYVWEAAAADDTTGKIVLHSV